MTDLALPVESFRDAAPLLRRPFSVDAVRWKPQSVTKTGKTLVVAFIDARLVVERLNLVCPHLWHDAYEPTPAGLMWCHLTVDGITRSDVGEGKGKALVSDALKRAAVRFGVGVSLYAIPQTYLDGEVKFLNAGHTRFLRERYTGWLTEHGAQAFGDPLDHGDAPDGSVGDPDEPAAPVEPEAPVSQKLVDEAVAAMTAAGIHPDTQRSQLAGADEAKLRRLIERAHARTPEPVA